MPRQFIRASKLPGAAFPSTLVGFLSWKKQRDTRFGTPSLFRKNQASTTDWDVSFQWDFPFGNPVGKPSHLTSRFGVGQMGVSISSLLL